MDDRPVGDAWSDAIYEHFKRAGVRQVAYVPDTGHTRLIARCIADPDIVDVVLTTEEEGVALAVGAALGGNRAALLMQSSGVGNCLNMFSILHGFGVPCLMLVTMRGEYREFNPWQIPMGSTTEAALKLGGFLVYRVDHADDIDDIVGSCCDMAYEGSQRIAILLGQRMLDGNQGGGR